MTYKKIKKGKICRKNFGGFTLIEVLIYIALSSLLLTGVIVSTYNLIDGNKWLAKHALALEEGHFAMQKINWLIQSENLKEDRADFEIYLESGRLWLRRGDNEPRAITSSRVTVENFNFTDGNLEFFIGGIIFKKRYGEY